MSVDLFKRSADLSRSSRAQNCSVTMKAPSKARLASALAPHRLRPPPLPPKFAQIFIEAPNAMLETIFVTPSRRCRLRSLFPGKSDTQIVNELIDVLLAQVGASE